jgi:hypothetical protein
MAKKVITPKILRFINWVNRTFPPASPGYDVAFIIKADGQALVTSENLARAFDGEEIRVVDYYGESRGGNGGPPWIHPIIKAGADKRGLLIDWEHAGAVSVREN